MPYKSDEGEGWYTIGVTTFYGDVYGTEDERDENYYGLDYEEKYTVGNIITQDMVEEWIQPTFDEYKEIGLKD